MKTNLLAELKHQALKEKSNSSDRESRRPADSMTRAVLNHKPESEQLFPRIHNLSDGFKYIHGYLLLCMCTHAVQDTTKQAVTLVQAGHCVKAARSYIHQKMTANKYTKYVLFSSRQINTIVIALAIRPCISTMTRVSFDVDRPYIPRRRKP